MRVIYQKIRHVRYLYIKRNVEKVWGARYLSKNTVHAFECLPCNVCIISSTHCASNILYNFFVSCKGERWKNEVKKFNQEYAIKISRLLKC
jgi:hypothetical protein